MLHTPAHKNVAAPAGQVQLFEVAVDFRTTQGQARVVTVFDQPLRARLYANEEVRWEDTIRVTCPRLGLDIRGDFASFLGTQF
jgi:hypothetical protein